MEQQPDDGEWYYSYLLFYVDDVLCIHHDAKTILHKLDKFFQMKPGSMGNPDISLGAKLKKVQLNNGLWCWAMSSSKYVQEAVWNVKKYSKKELQYESLPKHGSGPWPLGFEPDTDESEELNPAKANYYPSLVGILHWILELGRVDNITETSVLAWHMAMPRKGHLDAALHMFRYLEGLVSSKHNIPNLEAL